MNGICVWYLIIETIGIAQVRYYSQRNKLEFDYANGVGYTTQSASNEQAPVWFVFYVDGKTRIPTPCTKETCSFPGARSWIHWNHVQRHPEYIETMCRDTRSFQTSNLKFCVTDFLQNAPKFLVVDRMLWTIPDLLLHSWGRLVTGTADWLKLLP